MRSQEFFNIISDIDERFVNEVRDDVRGDDIRRDNAFSETQRPQILRPERSAPKAFLKPIMCSAACLAIAGGAALGFATFARSGGIRTAPADVPDSGTVISGAASPGVSLGDNSDQASSSEVGIDSTEQSVDVQPQYVLEYIVDGKYKGTDGLHNYYDAHYKDIGYSWGGGTMNCPTHPHQFQYSLNCNELRVKCDLTGYDVYSLDGGKVVYAGTSDFGNLVIIRHTNEDYSAYGYLGDLLVKVGDCVENGSVIAKADSARNYVNDADRDKLRCDIMMLRLDREFTLDEWNVYSSAHLESDIKIHDKVIDVGRMGEYYNAHYNDTKISHGRASGCLGSMVVYPSGYEYSKNCDVLDIELNNIGSDIYTMDSGKVVYAGASDFGNLIIIKHAEDDYSAYGYLGEVLVKVGDNVLDGDVIARSGSARNYSDKATWDVTVLRFDREITLNEWNDYSALVLKTPWHSSRSMQLSLNGNN